jgi:hypothetical protein
MPHPDDPAEYPTAVELLEQKRTGTYDAPALAMRLGLTESHVRLVLSTTADAAEHPDSYQ